MGKEAGTDDLRAAKANAKHRPRRTRSPIPTGAANGSCTSLQVSATSSASTIPPSLDSQSQTQDIPPPPGQASSMVSTASSTSGVRRLDSAKQRTTRRSVGQKVKSSLSDDETTLVDSTHHNHDDSNDAALFTPGAFSVSGNDDSVEFSNNNNDIAYKREYRDPDPDPSVSLVVAAEVVTDNDDDKEKGRVDEEDLELKIAKAVESRLMQRDQSLVVAEVVPPASDDPLKGESPVVYHTSCAQCCSDCCMKWKYPIVILLLGLCGAVVAIALSEASSVEPAGTSPPSRPGIEFRQEEIKQIVQQGADIAPFEDPDSPQSLALAWLLTDPISTAPDNFTPAPLILQRYALAVLYYSTNGNLWTNTLGFLTDLPTCQWKDGQTPVPSFGYSIPSLPATYGIHCDSTANVKQIRLSQNGLDGTIPTELTLLLDLQVLGVDQNAVKGSIPPELGRLTDMRMLLVENNTMTGTIPTELGLWFSLESFHANDNRFQGTLPTEFGRLSNLRDLYVYNNFLTGTIPSEFSNNPNVEVVFDPQQVL